MAIGDGAADHPDYLLVSCSPDLLMRLFVGRRY
jgi:hypothetical protein